MSDHTEAPFVQRLTDVVPGLSPVLDDHLRDNARLRPRAFMADVKRFATDHAGDASVLAAMMPLLDEALMSADPDLVTLVSTSFLENMNPREPSYDALRASMGPVARAQLDRLRSLWD